MAKRKISAAQFFISMFVSRVVVTIALNGRYTGGENMLESIVSYVLAMGLGFLIALPIWGLQKRRPQWDVARAAVEDMGARGKPVPLLYFLYFVVVNGTSLALFQLFLMDTINPAFSAALVTTALVGAALYGALRGIETVARCAACVFVLLLLGCGLVFGIVAWRFSADNFEPLFYNGFHQTYEGVLLFIARTSVFADMAMLLPMVKGRKGLGFACWAGGTALFVGLLLFLVAGCLGRYAYTQNFPVYALAAITQVRSMQRLDAVFTGVWMMGLVVKLAFDMYGCRLCLAALKSSPDDSRGGAWAAALLILAVALCTALLPPVRAVLLDTRLLCICTVAAGFLLPLLVLVSGLFRKKTKAPEDGA